MAHFKIKKYYCTVIIDFFLYVFYFNVAADEYINTKIHFKIIQ